MFTFSLSKYQTSLIEVGEYKMGKIVERQNSKKIPYSVKKLGFP
jgi:hypothetical protein